MPLAYNFHLSSKNNFREVPYNFESLQNRTKSHLASFRQPNWKEINFQTKIYVLPGCSFSREKSTELFTILQLLLRKLRFTFVILFDFRMLFLYITQHFMLHPEINFRKHESNFWCRNHVDSILGNFGPPPPYVDIFT